MKHQNQKKNGDQKDDNQGQRTSPTDLYALLESASLPLEHVVYAFGYGSGVFSQTMQKQQKKQQPQTDINDSSSSPLDHMVDIILVVNDSEAFHRANMQVNAHHYPSSWKYMSSHPEKIAVCLQRQSFMGLQNPGVYYCVLVGNTLTLHPPLKYGIVQLEDLATDLTRWSSLYLAGRMHKPVLDIDLRRCSEEEEEPSRMRIAQLQANHNLPAALATSLLLLLPPKQAPAASSSCSSDSVASCLSDQVDETSIFETISALSYTGDFRMRMRAEDPHKITNLVHSPGALSRFRALYQSSADALMQQGLLSIQATTDNNTNNADHHHWTWDTSPSAQDHLLQQLPWSMQQPYRKALDDDNNTQSSLSSSATTRATQVQAAELLGKTVAGIVAPAARYQAIKGVFTAGPWRVSLQYALRKLRKGQRSK